MIRTKIAREHPIYRRALEREGRFWKGQESDPARPNMQHPVLQAYKDEVESGSDRFSYLKSLGPFTRGLSIGCGSANVEIALLKRGIVKEFVLVDVSRESLETIERALTPQLRSRVTVLCQDINFLELKEKYDFIFCANVLHHIINLEHVLLEMNRALTRDGILFIDDFVGEDRFQFSDERIAMINAIGALVQEKTGARFLPMTRTGRAALINSCPFEAIRSSELRGLLEQLFARHTLRQGCYGAVSSWANVVLDMEPRSAAQQRSLAQALEIFITFDKLIARERLLPQLYLSGTYRKNPRPLAWRVKRWSKRELAHHLPVRALDERHALRAGALLYRHLGDGIVYRSLKRAYMRLRG